MSRIISNQADWLTICPEFENSSQYQEFGKKYQFNPMSKIYRTGLSVNEVLLKTKMGPGHRRKIFEEYLRDGRTVKEVNDDTRTMKAGRDYDIFIGLFRGFIRLSESVAANGYRSISKELIDSGNAKGGVMTKITIPAARVKQGDLILYSTSIRVKDLVANNFYTVETLDPENTSNAGYQRLLNTARAKKLADYILKGQDSNDAFLPTSVLLATDKAIAFNSQNNTIEIDTVLVGPFSVVDGQHRLEGLKMAASKDPRVLDFEVPVNIAINLPHIAQMCHFLIVNTTQKSVDKSVEQRLIARLTEALDVEDMPSLPKWILNMVEKGEVDKALKYVIYLNETADSPWKGKIRMANDESEDTTIAQRSFVKAIVKYILTANNPLTIIKDFDKEKKIFLNYWKAIAELLDDGNAAVLYKYNGVDLFCKFSIPFFMKLQDRGNFTVSTMKLVLKSCFENVEGDYAGVGHPEWWASGSNASFLNAGAINVISQEMSKALHKVSMNAEIEI